MPYSNKIRKETLRSLADVSNLPFWLDNPARPVPEPALSKDIATDLLIIGAGFTGLWTALLAKQANPSRDVVIVEAGEVATGASGRKMAWRVGRGNFLLCLPWV
jgi:NADPH-dependent 2,4-dienoyl-CoA reductase/sulfur reductase-like enzyme